MMQKISRAGGSGTCPTTRRAKGAVPGRPAPVHRRDVIDSQATSFQFESTTMHHFKNGGDKTVKGDHLPDPASGISEAREPRPNRLQTSRLSLCYLKPAAATKTAIAARLPRTKTGLTLTLAVMGYSGVKLQPGGEGCRNRLPQGPSNCRELSQRGFANFCGIDQPESSPWSACCQAEIALKWRPECPPSRTIGRNRPRHRRRLRKDRRGGPGGARHRLGQCRRRLQ